MQQVLPQTHTHTLNLLITKYPGVLLDSDKLCPVEPNY